MSSRLSRRLRRVACALFFVFPALNLSAKAQTMNNLVTFKLTSVTERGPGTPKPIVSGNWTLLTLNPTQDGGTATAVFHVTSGLGPGNVPCAGRHQNVSFKWIFNRDPTYITTSEPLSVQLLPQADSGPCAPNDPIMSTSPMQYFQQTPPMDEATNSVFFQPPSRYKNQPVRSIQAPPPSLLYPGGFSVFLIGNTANPNGALAIEIDYNYTNVPTVALPPPGAGKPGCTSTSWVISPMSGATLNENQVSTGGAACTTNITTKLPVASVQIAIRPSHGTLTQTGPLSLVYKPNPGFHGVNQYSFRYCGSNGSSSGCATLNYSVQVQ